MGKGSRLGSVINCTLLETFVRVAEMGNISAAARSLFLAQSAVSGQMAVLSRAAGAPLMERVHGRWRLTAAGVIFDRRARELLALVDLLERDLADTTGLVAGHIVLASTRTISDSILADIVAGFTSAHRDIRLEIFAGDRHDAELHLAAGEVDAALVALPIGLRGLRVESFSEDLLVLVVPEGHRLADRGLATFDEVADEPFVMFDRNSGVRALLEERLGERFAALDIRLELTSNDALLRCVEARIGLTFLPERVARRQVGSAPVRLVRIVDIDLSRKLAYVALAAKTPSIALQRFEAWLLQAFRNASGL